MIDTRKWEFHPLQLELHSPVHLQQMQLSQQQLRHQVLPQSQWASCHPMFSSGSTKTASQQERLRHQFVQQLEQRFQGNATSDLPGTGAAAGNAGMLLGAAAAVAAAVGASGAAPRQTPPVAAIGCRICVSCAA
ncbi:hypothetical protein OEZ85_008637 [Tetradesmus obliquus]|uniref:Uncharacterized protein n=1 Tax=Tetradesmus obliquus TaxID=3088 RepID=A0ABY8TP24_TETOB|nr:hypothetical protein OEZ85_008637 [Tetradesmus obliquus]